LTDNIDKLVSDFIEFFNLYKVPPPCWQELLCALSKRPDRYMSFCLKLAQENPQVMKALISDQHGEDVACTDGKQCGEYEKDYL